MLKISDLSLAPESHEVDVLDRIPKEILKISSMARIEKQFINGLIRIFKPQRILEIGVKAGGSTAILLNAISDMPNSTLTSIEILTELDIVLRLPKKPVGFAVEMLYPEKNKQWNLYKGKDISEICEEINEKFDFCIIDTAHMHPVESLNFLCALPYLSDGAIVVFHDISYFKMHPLNFFPDICFANILSYGTIVGEKIVPVDKNYLFSEDTDHIFSNQCGFANIGAVQISEHTRNNIKNVFDMLLFPWAGYSNLVGLYIKHVAKVIKKNYPPDLFKVFCEAAKINALMVHNDYKYEKASSQIRLIYDTLSSSEKIVFYGGGACGKHMLELFKRNKLPTPTEIWDINAEGIIRMEYIPVVEPKFQELCTNYSDTIFIVTVMNKTISKEIAMKLLCAIKPKKIYLYDETVKSISYVEASDFVNVD